MLNLWVAFKSMVRTNSDGQKIFYPNGKLGAGYIIPSDEVYKRIRNGYIALSVATIVLAILDVILMIVLNLNIYAGIIGLIIIYLVIYYTWVHAQTRNLVKEKKI